MDKKELLKKVYEASTAETARYLTDDFQATFANGNPSMDKDTWIGSGVLMEAAMPDMVWEFDYIGEDGDDGVGELLAETLHAFGGLEFD